MAVTFVIGRAGSGKTTRCFRGIVDALRARPLGPAVLWVVPKQATFMAERMLTCESGLGAFCRARVLSFEQLATEALADCGGCALPQVTPLGRQMVLGHLLRRLQPRLHYYKSAARQVGLAVELDGTFAELERCGKGAGDLAALVAELEVANPADSDGRPLLAKMRDLRLVYDAYGAFLGQDRLDPHRRLTRVLEVIADWPLLRGATAHVDGFLDFSDEERRTLAVLGRRCERVEITLALDPGSPTVRNLHHLPDDMSLFRRTEEAYRRLWFTFDHEHVAVTEPVLLTDAPRFRSPSLAAVERDAFQDPPPQAHDGGLGFVEAPDPSAEVEALARNIRALVAEGYRYRDVAVLARDLDDYHALLDVTFREHGIPYFVDRRRTAGHHPLLQFVRAALQVARFDWPHDAVMTLLKSGLAGVTLDEADELEDYVLLHRIRGGAWESTRPWNYRRDLTRPAGGDDGPTPAQVEAARVDALRRGVADRLAPFAALARAAEPPAVRAWAVSLLQLLERCGARETIAGWMAAAAEAGDIEQHDEHAQVWAELNGLLGQMADLLGDERATAAEFAEVLESGLERFDLAITPPTVDQVLVGQVDRTRTPPGLRACFVLGLSAGQFPRASREQTVLSDAERRELRGRRVELEGDGRRSLLDERLLGYIAFTRASDRLIVSRPLATGGERAAEPSPFWQQLRSLFPQALVKQAPPLRKCGLADAWTPRQLVVSLAEWVREGRFGSDDAPAYAAAYHHLATHSLNGDALAAARSHAWSALRYRNEAELSPGVANQLFPQPFEATAARLETFAACPFRHFIRYGLGLTEREAQGVTGLDLSRVYHHVMQRLIACALRSGIDLADPAGAVTDEMIHDCAAEVGKALRGELMLASARNEYLLSRVERTLKEVVAAQREMMRRGRMRPAAAGVLFDAAGRAALPPLVVRTPGGADVTVRGSIDRLDVSADGAHAAVIDYRLGGRSLPLQEVFYGLSLQLLTDLLAVEAGGAALSGEKPRPSAALYLQMARGLSDVKHPDEALDPTDPRYLLRVKPRGIVESGAVPAFDAGPAEGASPVLNAFLKKDGTFGKRGATDVAEPAEFRGLLAHVRRRLGELADGILSGEVAVFPYRMGTDTPCPRCPYKSVCRFDPALNPYHNLNPVGREQVLAAVSGGGADGAA